VAVVDKKPVPRPKAKQKPKVPASVTSFMAKYPASYTAMLAIPELKNLILAAVSGKNAKKPLPVDVVQRQIENSDWWRSNNATFKARFVQERQNPGEFNNALATKRIEVQNTLNESGLNLNSAQIDLLTRNAYLYGFNDQQLKQAAIGHAVVVGKKIVKGKDTHLNNSVDVLGDANSFSDTAASTQLLQYAKDMGVTLSASEEAGYRRRLAGGEDVVHVMGDVLNTAKTVYEPFAKDLSLTNTLATATAAYRKHAAALLEVPEDQITFDDPLMKLGKGFISTTADGTQAKTTLSEFDDMVKGDPRWLTTQNANDEYSQLANDMLTRMGFM
jgi:hypothetical protein